jgi:hypothetical protein
MLTIKVLDNAGKTIRLQHEVVKKGINDFEVKNVSALPAGQYILELITDEKNLSTKIQKQ